METATQERTSRTFEPSTMPDGDATTLAIGATQRVIGALTELSTQSASGGRRRWNSVVRSKACASWSTPHSSW